MVGVDMVSAYLELVGVGGRNGCKLMQNEQEWDAGMVRDGARDMVGAYL